MARNKETHLDLVVRLKSEAAVKKFRKDLMDAAAKIDVGLDLRQSTMRDVIKKLQQEIDKNPVHLFNCNTKFDQVKLAEYMRRLTDEIDKYMEKHSGITLKIDTDAIRKQLDDFKVNINLDSSNVNIDMEALTNTFQSIVSSLNDELRDLDLGQMFTDASNPLNTFATQLHQTFDVALTSARELHQLLTDMAANPVEVVVNTQNSTAGGGGTPSTPVVDLDADFVKSSEKFSANFEKSRGTLEELNRLMNTLRGEVDDVRDMLDFTDTSFFDIEQEVLRVSSALNIARKEQEKLQNEHDALLKSQASGTYSGSDEQALKDMEVITAHQEAMRLEAERLESQLSRVNASFSRFREAANDIDASQKAMSKLSDTLMRLNMTGVELPRVFREIVGKVQGVMENIKPLANSLTSWLAGMFKPGNDDAVSFVKNLSNAFATMDAQVMDSNGKVMELGEAVKKSMEESFRDGFAAFYQAEGTFTDKVKAFRARFQEAMSWLEMKRVRRLCIGLQDTIPIWIYSNIL